MYQYCTAENVADELLFETAQSLLADDFAPFSACFGQSHVVETSQERAVIDSMDEIRRKFDDLRDYYESQLLIDVVRAVVKAHFIGSET